MEQPQSFLKILSLQKQLRLMTGISVLGMLGVVVFVMFNLNQLRHEFNTYQSIQTMDKNLIEIKATALAISRADPLLPETAVKLENADAHIQMLQQRLIRPADVASQEALSPLFVQWEKYAQGLKGAIVIAKDSPQDALLIPDALFGAHLAPMVTALDGLVEANTVNQASSEATISTLMSQILWVVLVPMVLLGVMTTVTQTLFGHHLRKRLEGIVDEITHLHNGDLTRRLSAHHNDEIGLLSQTINNFIARFDAILFDVHHSADRTRKTADGVSRMAHSVTANAKEQSDKVFEVSNAIEEMGNTIKHISENAAQSSSAAQKTLSLVQLGGETGQSTLKSLKQIDQTVGSSVHTMSELNRAIHQIGKVSGMIKDIAEQTNLLALNAAIEAARAGDQGRGFAVVADEVRKLAERTANATADITDIVQSIEHQTDEATQVMALAQKEVAQGVAYGEDMGQLLRQIEDSVHIVTDMMNQIATATEVQSAAGEHLWRNINSVANISANTASNIEKARNEMLTLADSSKALYETVGQFKLASAV